MARFDDENKSKKIPRTRLCYAADEKHAEKLISLLRDAGIDAVRQGGVSDIYMAHSKMGEEIMVPTEDLEKACEVLAEFDPAATKAAAAGTAAAGGAAVCDTAAGDAAAGGAAADTGAAGASSGVGAGGAGAAKKNWKRNILSLIITLGLFAALMILRGILYGG